MNRYKVKLNPLKIKKKCDILKYIYYYIKYKRNKINYINKTSY